MRTRNLLLALITVFGLQMLRLLLSETMAVYRDRLGATALQLALFVLGTFVLAFAAPLWPRILGLRRALIFTAAGVTLVRLILQLTPDAVVRWLLAAGGVLLFLWFVPICLGYDRAAGGGRFVGAAWLAGLALDTLLQGLFGTYDYAWTINAGTILLALALASAAVALLWNLTRRVTPSVGSSSAFGNAWPLIGFGALLFLEVLAWHNLAWQNTIWDPAPWKAVHNHLGPLTGLTLVADVAWLYLLLAHSTRRTWQSPILPLAGVLLIAAGVVGISSSSVPLFFAGHAGASIFLAAIGVQVPRAQARPGIWRTSAAWALGMLLFVILIFAYYVAYDIQLPFDGQVLFYAAAGVGVLAGLRAWWMARRADWPEQRLVRRPLPALGAISAGLLLFVGWGSLGVAMQPARPVASQGGQPLRVMTYNQHYGFDVYGWSDLDALAGEINASRADVVALQEVARGWYINGSTDMLAQLQTRTHMPYALFAGAADAIWGNSILSRYPILNSETRPLPRGYAGLKRNYLKAQIDVGNGQSVTVIATHLHHTEDARGQDLRLTQLPVLLEDLGGASRTILMGDFNATPDSPEHNLVVQAGLRDAYPLAGGRPEDELTYASNDMYKRIDYIWLSGDLQASDFKATTRYGSDHRGIALTVR